MVFCICSISSLQTNFFAISLRSSNKQTIILHVPEWGFDCHKISGCKAVKLLIKLQFEIMVKKTLTQNEILSHSMWSF